jgi:hypothetical protein
MEMHDVRSLLDGPSPAALVTYRPDGSADVSPVWFRATDSALEVVIAADDPKVGHIASDERVVLTVFEAVPPFRGVKVAGGVTPDRDQKAVREAREAIAPRYLGESRGAAFIEGRGPGVVIRLPITSARTWDLRASLPPADLWGHSRTLGQPRARVSPQPDPPASSGPGVNSLHRPFEATSTVPSVTLMAV